MNVILDRIDKKIRNYRNKRKIKKLPIWYKRRLYLDRDIKLGDKPILCYDFSEQLKRNKRR